MMMSIFLISVCCILLGVARFRLSFTKGHIPSFTWLLPIPLMGLIHVLLFLLFAWLELI